MKVCAIVHQFPCLSETFILNQFAGLKDLGYDLDIFAWTADDHETVHDLVKKHDLQKSTHYYSIHKYRAQHGKVGSMLKMAGAIARRPALFVKTLGQQDSIKNFFKSTIFADAQKQNYDVLHCHFGPSGIIGAALKKSGVITCPIITAWHGFDVSSYVKTHGVEVYKDLFEVGDLHLVISAKMKEELIALGCPADRVMIHRIGVDTNKFNLKVRSLSDSEPVKLFSIARLVEKKGTEFSIRAMVELKKKYPGIQYNIAGDGPLREELQTLINQLGLQDTVTLLGWQNQDQIISLLGNAHIFVCTSVVASNGDQEGAPTVLVEASAQGLPILATWHSGIPDIVLDGKSGYLVPERDVPAIEERISYMIEHSDEWEALGRAGRDHVYKEYDDEGQNNKLDKIYKKLAENAS